MVRWILPESEITKTSKCNDREGYVGKFVIWVSRSRSKDLQSMSILLQVSMKCDLWGFHLSPMSYGHEIWRHPFFVGFIENYEDERTCRNSPTLQRYSLKWSCSTSRNISLDRQRAGWLPLRIFRYWLQWIFAIFGSGNKSVLGWPQRLSAQHTKYARWILQILSRRVFNEP